MTSGFQPQNSANSGCNCSIKGRKRPKQHNNQPTNTTTDQHNNITSTHKAHTKQQINSTDDPQSPTTLNHRRPPSLPPPLPSQHSHQSVTAESSNRHPNTNDESRPLRHRESGNQRFCLSLSPERERESSVPFADNLRRGGEWGDWLDSGQAGLSVFRTRARAQLALKRSQTVRSWCVFGVWSGLFVVVDRCVRVCACMCVCVAEAVDDGRRTSCGQRWSRRDRPSWTDHWQLSVSMVLCLIQLVRCRLLS